MRADMVRYFIMATLESTAVSYSFMPDSADSFVTVYSEPDVSTVHTDTKKVPYQAMIRGAKGTYVATEAIARAIFNAVHKLQNLTKYDGMYLSAEMDATTDPITFAPDDNATVPTTKVASFAVNDYIMIDTEIMKVTGVTSPNVTASRAKLGTVKAIHTDNTEILNITKNPIPGETCQSCKSTSGVLWLENDEKLRPEFSVNWEVVCK